MNKQYFVYILTSRKNGTLYAGVTDNLIRRVYEHKHNLLEGFTKKHRVHHLVYFEITKDINAAIHREKCIKKWKRVIPIGMIYMRHYYNSFPLRMTF